MNSNKNRIAHFTSSNIHRLCGSLKNGTPSKAFYTYIDDVYLELVMGRSCDVDVNTKPLKYGSLMEVVLFQKNELGLDYRMMHKVSVKHDTIPYYSGSPDVVDLKKGKVGEIKCFYPKKFCKLALCLNKKDVQLLKNDFSEIYWQVVSNCILLGVDTAEVLTFMPYKDELIDIIEQVEQTNLLEGNNLNPTDYWFLANDDIETLPFLPNDSKIKNINRFEFEVPKNDKEFLISRIKEAGKILDSYENK